MRSKIAITLDSGMLKEIDGLVRAGVFRNRSQAIQEAVEERLRRVSRSRLAVECAKLVPEEEKAFAEEGMSREIEQWPEY